MIAFPRDIPDMVLNGGLLGAGAGAFWIASAFRRYRRPQDVIYGTVRSVRITDGYDYTAAVEYRDAAG